MSIEMEIADAVKTVLVAEVESSIQEVCPVVTFYDPMSIDEASRCIVQTPTVQTAQEWSGNFEARIELGIKSQWTQATLAEDTATHAARVKAFRAVLLQSDFGDLLGVAATTFSVWFVNPDAPMATDPRENWFYSELILTIQGGFKAEE
jgi:hypothetical protein